ncbi:ATP-grasp domain-containing protein [Roseofilum sp. BLCC_M91]|uniref:ATP-grasp domain-containing protein n=1 Tax=Roseofilum halophilum BLCC-M91 TaxID=3022259 RepID=A0ABT7BQM4_9CYAN|nr:ATP-grasp domain-containing protein [Roseofilum halophilum]MDJ1181502.1 ATP-grasp domain-containing protein [Roseofilum halophilum BLCC-M91]
MALILLIQSRVYALFQNLAVLALLAIVLPFNLCKVLPGWVWLGFSQRFEPQEDPKPTKNLLISGAKMTKSLQLARLFQSRGHQVYLLEEEKYWMSGNQFSNVVAGFYTVPNPKKNWNKYCKHLLEIIQTKNIDIFIPVSSAVGSYDESRLKAILSPYCEVFHFDPEITELLDNKFTFIEKAKILGLSVPKSFLITNFQQILDFDFAQDGSQYILKSIPYDSVRRLDMTKLPMKSEQEMEAFVKKMPISKDKSWIMQEFIRGKEYCTHSTVRNGKIRLHCCCESSEFQVNYHHVEEPKIYQWVETFVKGLNLTGQISFDFIKTEDGQVYPLECNPRTHSAITTFHNHPGVADAYLKDAEDETKSPIFPLPDSKATYWTYHELWRLTGIRSFGQFKAWMKRITEGTDGIFQWDDPLPFLMVHHWQIPVLLLQNLKKMKGWVRIDFNIGKLIELDWD